MFNLGLCEIVRILEGYLDNLLSLLERLPCQYSVQTFFTGKGLKTRRALYELFNGGSTRG